MLFQQLLYKYNHCQNDHFKEKLFSTLESLWVSRFDEVELLGYGAFGLVFKAKDNSNSDGQCALKFVVPSTEQEKSYVLAEIQQLNSMDHPNVVQMVDFIEEKDFTENELRVRLSVCTCISGHNKKTL